MFGMTPYSSPELVRKNRTLDSRTDVWSLGCIFYELLAAVPPFQGDAAELMLRITRDDPIPLSQLRPDVPRELDQIVSWALAKDPGSRFSSVYALAHALKPFATPEGQVLIDRIGRLAHTKDTDRPAAPPLSPTSPLSKRSSSAPPPRAPERTMLMPTEYDSYESYDEVSYERTQFLGDDAFSPASQRGGPPPSSRTSSRGSIPPPSHPGGSGSWSALAIDPDPHGSPYSTAGNTGGWPAPTALGQQQRKRQRKAAVIAFGASLLLLPALVMVLVITLRGQVGRSFAGQQTETEKEAPPTQTTKETSEAASAAPGINTEPPTPVEAGNDQVPDRPTPRPSPVAKFPPQPQQKPTKVSPAPAPPPEDEEDEPEEPGGGETGTLVAIAIGGSCAFAVDGAPQGNKSSIRVTVPVGPHTVSCSPKGKASRTQRVNVKPGKPGMATFRLN
jgi:serine/threonine-protein kinase